MKTNMWKTSLVTAALAGLAMGGSTALAQNTTATPVLSPAAQQVLQLEQAKISDDIVLAYIRNSGSSYGLTADQIVYLRAQGVSSPVLTAMLNSAAPATTVPPPTSVPAASATVAAATTAIVPHPHRPRRQPRMWCRTPVHIMTRTIMVIPTIMVTTGIHPSP